MEITTWGVQLAGFDANHDPKVRKWIGESICTKAMARRKWLKVAKDFPKAIVQIQKGFQKLFSPKEKHFVLSPNERQELPRPKADLG